VLGDLAALGVGELVLTRGPRVDHLHAGPAQGHSRLPAAHRPDGRRDAFATAYLVARNAGFNPAGAARRATAVRRLADGMTTIAVASTATATLRSTSIAASRGLGDRRAARCRLPAEPVLQPAAVVAARRGVGRCSVVDASLPPRLHDAGSDVADSGRKACPAVGGPISPATPT